jgi:geranylgeranyl pyrophosphate synthase
MERLPKAFQTTEAIMGKSIKKFKVELECTLPSTSSLEVEATDTSQAWMKAMNFIKGQKVKGIKGLVIHIDGTGRKLSHKSVKSIRDVEFDHPDSDGIGIKISHVSEE